MEREGGGGEEDGWLGSFLFINVRVRNESSQYRNHMSQLFCLNICF